MVLLFPYNALSYFDNNLLITPSEARFQSETESGFLYDYSHFLPTPTTEFSIPVSLNIVVCNCRFMGNKLIISYKLGVFPQTILPVFSIF